MDRRELARALSPQSEPYWLALGQFIDAYVAVEVGMQEILAIETGVSPATAKAIFQGLQIDRAYEALKKIWAAAKREPPAFLKRALAQLVLINASRNDILHRGARFDGEHWLVATKNGEGMVRVVTVETLHAMALDTITISLAFSAHAMEFGVGRTQEIRTQFIAAVEKDWSFKPVIENRRSKE